MNIVQRTSFERRDNVATHLGVVEERVHAPREGLLTLVHVLVRRDFGEFAAVLVLLVLNVRGMFGLDIAHPEDGSDG